MATQLQDRHETDVGHPLSDAVAALAAVRREARERGSVGQSAAFPLRAALTKIILDLSAALYPRRLGRFQGSDAAEDGFVAAKLGIALTELEREVGAEVSYWQQEAAADFEPDQAATIVRLFAGTLGEIRRQIDSDVAAMQCDDGAAGYVDIVARLLTATFGGGGAAAQSRAEEANGETRDPFAGIS